MRTRLLPLAKNHNPDHVARGLAQAMFLLGRVHAYLPFKHSENLADQDRAVTLIPVMDDEADARFARAPRDVVFQYQPGSGFGGQMKQ